MRIQYNRIKLYSLLDVVSNYKLSVTLPSFKKEVDRTVNKKKSMLWERNANKDCRTGFDGLGFKGSLKRADTKWGNQIKDEIKEFLPYKVVETYGAEADDVIATLCKHYQSEKVMIV
jgi:hypothetical protein